MYSTHIERKSVASERSIRTLKSKIYKYMTSISKNVYIDKLKVGDHVRISEYKNIFAKGYVPNWSEHVFVIKKSQKHCVGRHAIRDLKGYEIVGLFYQKV